MFSRFRWAVCQLDSLGNCLNLPGLRKALASLPKTLDETYARILCSIDEDHYKYAFKILQWLTYSLRPLELEEVAETVAIDVEGSPRFDPENRLPEPLEIVTICASLISLDDQTDEGESRTIVRLAHFSVKEYLVSNRIRQSNAKQYSIREIDANISIYSDCLVYIMDVDGSRFSNDELPTEYPLALYAMEYWTDHARVAERHPSFGSDLVKEFFARRDGLSNRIYLRCQLSLFGPIVPLGSFVFSEMKNNGVELGDICPPLHFASLTGLYKVVEILLEEGADVHAQSKEYGYALPVIQSMHKCHDVSEQELLDRHAQSKKYGYALPVMISMARCYDVSEQRLLELVQMFLDRGVHVDSRSGSESGSTALYLACSHGYDRIVQLLLENGAKSNAKGLLHGNALRAASSGGHHRIVKVLLEAGADIHGAFLPEPCRMGHSQVVQILLDKGADINAQTNIYGPALYEASAKGDVQIVPMLLEKGADVNARNEHHSLSALQVAAARGYNRVIGNLLANDADVTGALQEATGWGNEETAQILLQHGVDVNNAESEYGSALLVALVVGHDRIAKTLLDHKADIRAEGGCPIAHNALEDALAFGDEHIAEVLFKRGAQISTRAAESDAKQLYERHRARIAEAFHPRKKYWSLWEL